MATMATADNAMMVISVWGPVEVVAVWFGVVDWAGKLVGLTVGVTVGVGDVITGAGVAL